MVIGIGALAGVLLGGRIADGQLARGRPTARLKVAAIAYAVAVLLFVPGLLLPAMALAVPVLVLATPTRSGAEGGDSAPRGAACAQTAVTPWS